MRRGIAPVQCGGARLSAPAPVSTPWHFLTRYTSGDEVRAVNKVPFQVEDLGTPRRLLEVSPEVTHPSDGAAEQNDGRGYGQRAEDEEGLPYTDPVAQGACGQAPERDGAPGNEPHRCHNA